MRRPRRRHQRSRHVATSDLPVDHPAMTGDRPRFPQQVRSATPGEWVLKGGEHSRKLGSHFAVGAWKGMRILSLTLAERTTCPVTCEVRSGCFGNNMPYAIRWRVDDALYVKLTVELEALADAYPRGFALRLHALGDFVDRQYLDFWLATLQSIGSLHIFGFTAWRRNSEMGSLMEGVSARWDRFSSDQGRRGAVVHDGSAPTSAWIGNAYVCPARPENSKESCGSCGFCVSSQDPLVLVRH